MSSMLKTARKAQHGALLRDFQALVSMNGKGPNRDLEMFIRTSDCSLARQIEYQSAADSLTEHAERDPHHGL